MKFNFSNNGLCAAGAKALAEALKDNQIMTELNISSNSLGKVGTDTNDDADMSGVIAISDTIPTMGAMTSLDISNNRLGAEGAKYVMAAIPQCK